MYNGRSLSYRRQVSLTNFCPWDGDALKKCVLVFLLLLCAGSAFAQIRFYRYKGPDGQIIFTDRKINRKGYKLVKRYIPPSEREAMRSQEAVRDVNTRRPRGKYVLSASQLDGLVTPIAKAYGVDPELAKAVILTESSGDARATSSKGAMGLMQLIPDTAKRFGCKNPYDPRQNIQGGIRYLRWLLAFFEGDVDLALAGYNAGENAVDKYRGIPPYKETQRYVKKVRRHYQEKTHPYDQRLKHRAKFVIARKKSELKNSKTAT